MTDFVKIFFVLCAMVAAFFVGKGYGEQTFLASDEYKNIAKTREELDLAKGELENAKAKLQNIIDLGDKIKTDDMLAQILQVFLADLGLQMQNRDLILQQAKKANVAAPVPVEKPQANSSLDYRKAEEAIQKLKKIEEGEQKAISQLVVSEERIGSPSRQRDLDNLRIRNLKPMLALANPESGDCNLYFGKFRGSVRAVTDKPLGSIIFELNLLQNVISGKISWLNNPNPPITTDINGGCGLKIPHVEARFFTLSDSRYLQVYSTKGIDTATILSGNMYEIMPAGSTQMLGSFWLKKGL